jgi:hypothetical protein
MTGMLEKGVRWTIKEITCMRVKDTRRGIMNQGKVIFVEKVQHNLTFFG